MRQAVFARWRVSERFEIKVSGAGRAGVVRKSRRDAINQGIYIPLLACVACSNSDEYGYCASSAALPLHREHDLFGDGFGDQRHDGIAELLVGAGVGDHLIADQFFREAHQSASFDPASIVVGSFHPFADQNFRAVLVAPGALKVRQMPSSGARP